jgi:hypothetical protein
MLRIIGTGAVLIADKLLKHPFMIRRLVQGVLQEKKPIFLQTVYSEQYVSDILGPFFQSITE